MTYTCSRCSAQAEGCTARIPLGWTSYSGKLLCAACFECRRAVHAPD